MRWRELSQYRWRARGGLRASLAERAGHEAHSAAAVGPGLQAPGKQEGDQQAAFDSATLQNRKAAFSLNGYDRTSTIVGISYSCVHVMVAT